MSKHTRTLLMGIGYIAWGWAFVILSSLVALHPSDGNPADSVTYSLVGAALGAVVLGLGVEKIWSISRPALKKEK